VHSFRSVADRAAVKLCAEQRVILDDDESDVASIEDASIANNVSREASPCTSLSTLLSLENGLEGDEIFEESLCSVLINPPTAMPPCPRDPSPACLNEPLQDQARQSDDDHGSVICERLKEPSPPTVKSLRQG
jgi:hypothetical protein